jgi:hypothetical protein
MDTMHAPSCSSSGRLQNPCAKAAYSIINAVYTAWSGVPIAVAVSSRSAQKGMTQNEFLLYRDYYYVALVFVHSNP